MRGQTNPVAPLWAGLVARINGIKDAPLGFVTPRLYRRAGVCKDIRHGNNGDFASSKGWDASTGIGVPDGDAIVRIL